jgi:hypothetical protein
MAAITLSNWPGLVHRGQNIDEIRSLLQLLPILPYAAFLVSALLGWRYCNAGLVFVSIVLAIAYSVISSYTGNFSTQEHSPDLVRIPAKTATYSLIQVPRFVQYQSGRFASIIGIRFS